jgi:uncharacterized protein YheU (UPF0270 family)
MEIPHTALAPDTLRNLVEEFVSREGTDYGDYTGSLADKVRQVLRQIESGRAVILYDANTSSCHIELRDRLDRQMNHQEDTEQ